MKNFIEELQWRGLIHDITPGTSQLIDKEQVTTYIGFDPTADSLHIGSLVPIMLLLHVQRSGHKAIALLGGATSMIGDPSGKTEERVLLQGQTLNHNFDCIRKQLVDLLPSDIKIKNNFDWMKKISFLDFMRDVGKKLTVNYMKAKDSVKNRVEDGMSFAEFGYQLVQGYDFVHLNKEHNCKIQMGGSDQW